MPSLGCKQSKLRLGGGLGSKLGGAIVKQRKGHLGAGFWKDFWTGFKKPFQWVWNTGKKILPAVAGLDPRLAVANQVVQGISNVAADPKSFVQNVPQLASAASTIGKVRDVLRNPKGFVKETLADPSKLANAYQDAKSIIANPKAFVRDIVVPGVTKTAEAAAAAAVPQLAPAIAQGAEILSDKAKELIGKGLGAAPSKRKKGGAVKVHAVAKSKHAVAARRGATDPSVALVL